MTEPTREALEKAVEERPGDAGPAMDLAELHAREGRRAQAARALMAAAGAGAPPAAFRRAAERLPSLGEAIVPPLWKLAFGERPGPLDGAAAGRGQRVGPWRLAVRVDDRSGEWFYAEHEATDDRALVIVSPEDEVIPEVDRWREVLDHPAFLSVVDVGRSEPLSFAVRPYVVAEPLTRWVGEARAAGRKASRSRSMPPGRSDDDPLSEVAREPRLPPRAIAEIAVQAAHGLLALAEAGEAHGDLRPETVRVSRHGRVVLDDPLRVRRARPRGSRAPEVASGGEPTPLSDVWELGRVVEWLLDQLDARHGLAVPLGDLAKEMKATEPARRPSLQRVVAELETART